VKKGQLKQESLDSIADKLYEFAFKQQEMSKFTEAVLCYSAALVIRPDFTLCANNLGNSLVSLKKFHEAEIILYRVTLLSPDQKIAHYNYAVALYRAGKLQDAIDRYNQALFLDQNFPEAFTNRGSAKLEGNDLEAALRDHLMAIILRPSFAKALCNIAVTLGALGQDEKAHKGYLQALKIDPHYHLARYNLAHIQLLQGKFEEGWDNYRYRKEIQEFQKEEIRESLPFWDGSDLAGKRILIRSEQGFGDIIQFCRYSNMFVSMGAWVVLEVYEALQSLIETMSLDHKMTVISQGDPIPEVDFQLSIMDCPYFFKTSLVTIPSKCPYLFADQNLVSRWRERLQKFSGFRVGLVWAGNPRSYERHSHSVDYRRSLSLNKLFPLLMVPGIDFISLQHGQARQEIDSYNLHHKLFDYMSLVHDFADTAALIENLDLVITVDTAVAHLAGALGKSVWILSRYDGCWRWLKNRDKSPWYPSAKIFRQTSQGQWDEVVERVIFYLSQIKVIREPESSQSLHFLGKCLRQTDKILPAIVQMERSLLIDHKNGDCFNDLGITHQKSGFSRDSRHHFEKAIFHQPDHSPAHNNYGNALQIDGQLSEAIHHYRLSIIIDPAHGQAWLNYGIAQETIGFKSDRIINFFDHARQSFPQLAQAHNNYAAACLDLDRAFEAEEAARRAFELKPAYGEALDNLSSALNQRGHYTEAAIAAQQAIMLNKESTSARVNLANALNAYGMVKEAFQQYIVSAILNPSYVKVWNNLGVVFQENRQISQAIALYRRTLYLNFNEKNTRANLSTLLLMRGDYLTGWPEFEWRHLRMITEKLCPFPRWNGERLAHKTILVLSEQGYGDIIQFSRFLPLLAKQGCKIYCIIPQPLHSLFEQISSVIFLSGSMPIPECDYLISLLSLPYQLKCQDHIILDAMPYLQADPLKSRQWIKRLAPLPGVKVGLVWAGESRKDDPVAHAVDRRRSIPLFLMKPLLNLTNVHFVSLQKGSSLSQIEDLEELYRPDNFDNDIEDFSDTAAIIMALDLVITVDTAVAHLAGTLGKETWLLSRFDGCWRWGENETISKWYPSVQIFRQARFNDWVSLIAQVTKKLTDFAEERLVSIGTHVIPEGIKQLFHQAVIAHQNGHFKKAFEDYKLILTSLPSHPMIFNHLGILSFDQGYNKEAFDYLTRSLLIQPYSSEALSNFGIILFARGNRDLAKVKLRYALILAPNFAQPLSNYARIIKEDGFLQEAIKIYRKALIIDPHQADIHANLGAVLLTIGDYKEGWREHEWRLKLKKFTPRDYGKPIWNGKDISGQTLLLHGEQGYGDVIQFSRFVSLLSARNIRIILEVYSPLASLLRSVEGVDQVISKGDIILPFDYHLPLMSIPCVLGLSLNAIPAKTPYLKADENKIALWKERLSHLSSKLIGLVWAGASRQEDPQAHYIDQQRSLHLKKFLPFLAYQSVDFISLQIGDSKGQLNEISENLRPFDSSQWLDDFSDTAALISCLDLIITVDTAVAHLAGALGKNVWVLSRKDSCWRWLESQNHSPWYPTLRLFRQEKSHDWDSVISRVSLALGELVEPKQQRWRKQAYQLIQQNQSFDAKRFLKALIVENPIDRMSLELSGLISDPEGLSSLHKILHFDPFDYLAWNNLGYIYQNDQRFDKALNCYKRSIICRPDRSKALLNMGSIHSNDKSQAYYRSWAIIVDPSFALAHNNQSAYLLDHGHLDRGLNESKIAIILDPFLHLAYNNLAISYLHLGLWQKVIRHVDHALVLYSDFPEAKVTGSMAKLAMGAYGAGWKDYEWRQFGGVKNWSCPSNNAPRWTGEPLNNRSILLVGEQGLGDQIQFSRFAKTLSEQGADVTLACDSSLVALFKTLSETIVVLDYSQPLPKTDFFCPLMSIPFVLGEDFILHLKSEPYLSARIEDSLKWKERLKRFKGLKVGLVWSGGVRENDVMVQSMNERRNIDITAFSPLFEYSKIKFISLQYGEKARDIHKLLPERQPLDCLSEGSDFSESAALVDNLDLVITVDTAMAHLAGAMGKKTFLLSRRGGCWRWQHHPERWYDQVTLFHQKDLGNWDDVIQSLSLHLGHD
jgi:tetratricopeptide (TPR) repeat protein